MNKRGDVIMTQESGRSLIEVIGVLAITAVMAVGAITMYGAMRARTTRAIASADMEQIVKNVRLLMQPRGDYTGVSVNYLVKSGALRNTHAPIGGDDWSVTASNDGQLFAINLTGLSNGDCAYFTTAVPTWATAVRVNGSIDDAGDHCLSSGNNLVSFIVE